MLNERIKCMIVNFEIHIYLLINIIQHIRSSHILYIPMLSLTLIMLVYINTYALVDIKFVSAIICENRNCVKFYFSVNMKKDVIK